MKKSEDSLRDLWDTIKPTITCTIRVPEGEKRKEQKAYSKKWP